MALINDILKKRTAASSFVPVNEQELAEQEKTTPVIPEIKASDQSNEQPADIIQPNSVSVSRQLDKPQGMTDEAYEYLRKWQEQSPYDPSTGEGIAARIFQESNPKPTEPDEKKIRNTKIIGSIADSLGLLSQMWSYGRGAHVEKRDYKDSASSKIAEQENNLRNIYLKQRSDYDKGLRDAQTKDLENFEANRKEALRQLIAIQKQRQEQGNKDREHALKEKYYELKGEEQKVRAQNYEDMARHRKVTESQGAARTAAYVRKISSSGTGKNDKYQMIFEASPNDKDVQTDNFGNKVKVFEMSKGEIDQYVRKALADPQFMKNHPELILSRPEYEGTGFQKGSYRYRPNQDIAAAYLQEEYEKGFKPSVANQTETSFMRAPWTPNDGEGVSHGGNIIDTDGESLGEWIMQ